MCNFMGIYHAKCQCLRGDLDPCPARQASAPFNPGPPPPPKDEPKTTTTLVEQQLTTYDPYSCPNGVTLNVQIHHQGCLAGLDTCPSTRRECPSIQHPGATISSVAEEGTVVTATLKKEFNPGKAYVTVTLHFTHYNPEDRLVREASVEEPKCDCEEPVRPYK